MSSTIQHANRNLSFKGIGPPERKSAAKTGKSGQPGKSPDALLGADKDFDLALSGGGRQLAAKKGIPHGKVAPNEGNVRPEEQKLSDRAKEYLASLREQYGDYDFLIADNVENPLDAAGPSDKKYIVMLSSSEIERMAADEEHGRSIMGKVESAIDTLNEVQEKGTLGEGVRFRRLAISFDENGTTKLFAELERMSARQRERMEAAREKRMEEKKAEEQKEHLPPPGEKPKVPGREEFYAAFKANIRLHFMTSGKALDLLQPEKDAGTAAPSPSSQTGIALELELEVGIGVRTRTPEGPPPPHMGHPGPHRGHGPHPSGPPHHAHGGHGPQPPGVPRHGPDAGILRIEAGSAEELLEKAKHVDWGLRAQSASPGGKEA